MRLGGRHAGNRSGSFPLPEVDVECALCNEEGWGRGLSVRVLKFGLVMRGGHSASVKKFADRRSSCRSSVLSFGPDPRRDVYTFRIMRFLKRAGYVVKRAGEGQGVCRPDSTSKEVGADRINKFSTSVLF